MQTKILNTKGTFLTLIMVVQKCKSFLQIESMNHFSYRLLLIGTDDKSNHWNQHMFVLYVCLTTLFSNLRKPGHIINIPIKKAKQIMGWLSLNICGYRN